MRESFCDSWKINLAPVMTGKHRPRGSNTREIADSSWRLVVTEGNRLVLIPNVSVARSHSSPSWYSICNPSRLRSTGLDDFCSVGIDSRTFAEDDANAVRVNPPASRDAVT